VSYNYIAENTIGFFLQPGIYVDVEPHTLRGNTMVNNSLLNFGILNYDWAGDSVAKLYNNVDLSNTVNGKPIYYWINRENDKVPSNAGFVALINCRNITVENLNLERNLEGVILAFSNNCTISGNNITDNGEQLIWGGGGIVLYRSSINLIYKNNVATNQWTGDGIRLEAILHITQFLKTAPQRRMRAFMCEVVAILTQFPVIFLKTTINVESAWNIHQTIQCIGMKYWVLENTAYTLAHNTTMSQKTA
jgi:parallel beta-helix repeat protein